MCLVELPMSTIGILLGISRFLPHEWHDGHEIFRYDTYSHSTDTVKIPGRFQPIFLWYMSKITKYSSKSPKMKASDHGLLGPCPRCIPLGIQLSEISGLDLRH